MGDSGRSSVGPDVHQRCARETDSQRAAPTTAIRCALADESIDASGDQTHFRIDREDRVDNALAVRSRRLNAADVRDEGLALAECEGMVHEELRLR